MADRPYVSFAEVKQHISIPDALRVLGLAGEFTDANGTLAGVCPLPEHRHGTQPDREQEPTGEGGLSLRRRNEFQRGETVPQDLRRIDGEPVL